MDWVAKNKETGEVISIICTSHGSKEELTYLEKGGIQRTLERSEFDKKFEPIKDIDVSFVIPSIIEGCRVNSDIQRVVYPIARKCTPDYYRVGDLVYISSADIGLAEYFGKSIYESIHCDYNRSGRFVFEIINIEKQPEEPGLCWLCLNQFLGPGKTNRSSKIPDLRVPLQFIRPFAKDAATYLKRIDMPY